VCHHPPVAQGVTLEPRPPPSRAGPSLLAVGTIVWLASELMFFGGLFAAYVTLRANSRVWLPHAVHLETAAAAIATVLLIASSGTIHLAGKARERGDRVGMQRWMIITLALGVVFVANQIREFFVLDFSASSSGFASMYYIMTGFHALHVFAGLLLIIAAVVVTMSAKDFERRAPVAESVTYYWHFVDVVWILLFLTLFVIR
jgi:cytochrome c oxidase subunit III